MMLHSHGFRQTVDAKPDIILVDESRMVKLGPMLKYFNLLHSGIYDLMSLAQGQNMGDLDNESLISNYIKNIFLCRLEGVYLPSKSAFRCRFFH